MKKNSMIMLMTLFLFSHILGMKEICVEVEQEEPICIDIEGWQKGLKKIVAAHSNANLNDPATIQNLEQSYSDLYTSIWSIYQKLSRGWPIKIQSYLLELMQTILGFEELLTKSALNDYLKKKIAEAHKLLDQKPSTITAVEYRDKLNAVAQLYEFILYLDQNLRDKLLGEYLFVISSLHENEQEIQLTLEKMQALIHSWGPNFSIANSIKQLIETEYNKMVKKISNREKSIAEDLQKDLTRLQADLKKLNQFLHP